MVTFVRHISRLAAQIDVEPGTDGMPGADLVEQILSWTQMVALWGSVASLFVGAAIYGLAQQGGNYGAAARGKTLVIGGVVGALLAGLAPTAVNMLFDAATPDEEDESAATDEDE